MNKKLLLFCALTGMVMSSCLLNPCVRAATQDEEDEYLDIPEEDASPEEVDDGKVQALATDTFESIIKDNTNVLVEFYAPWCGHCQALAPEYAKASVTLAEKAPNVILAKVDATVETELAEKYGVQGFPTLYWFHEGKESEYTGGRDEAGIVSWVMKKVGPPATTVSTSGELATQEEGNDVVVVGYFSELPATSEAFKTFESVCRDIDFPCLQTSVAEVAQAAGAPLGSISVVNQFEGESRETSAYSGSMESEELISFINGKSLPLVVPFMPKYSERIFGGNVPHHLLFVGEAEDLSTSQAAFGAFSAVAASYQGKGEFIFVSVNSGSEDAEAVMNFFELEDTTLPVVVGFEQEPSQRKFRMKGDLTEADLKAFAAGIKDGSVLPDFKSEEVPEEGEDFDGNVKIVVGKSFDDVVKDPTKDVLLEVYAPWCGHCKSLEPIYRKLATRFKDISSVVIAKMDGTANEHKDLSVGGFPYLAFYPAKEGAEVVEFDGDRTLKALTKFIKEHAVVSYELPKKPTETDAAKDEL